MMTTIIAINRDALCYRTMLSLSGAKCDFATNSARLLFFLNSWRCPEDDSNHARFKMNVMVKNDASADTGQNPYFRGLHHVVVASFGQSAVFVFDLLRRTVNALVTREMAQDVDFWNSTLLPVTIGVLGVTVRVLPVHCACLSMDGGGLLIAGASGAGKSTLSVALAQRGLGFVSDDWTYVSPHKERLLAHGMSVPVKLLPDAVHHFPELASHQTRQTLNGELAYELWPEQDMGLEVIRCCEPRWVVFPERSGKAHSELAPIPAAHTQAYLEANVESLPAQLAAVAQKRSALIRKLAILPCWRFRFGGTPQFAAGELLRLFSELAGKTA